MQTEVQEKPIVDSEGNELFILVVIPKLPSFGVERPMDLEICGRTIEKWIDGAVSTYPYRKVDASSADDIVSLIRKHETRHKYTMVVYGDTPLLTSASIQGALLFAKTFSHKGVKLPRGWLFETEYIKTTEKVDVVPVNSLAGDDFIPVFNYSQLSLATSVMRGRINSVHMANGVQMEDTATSYIDADVIIEKGVIIRPNTMISGNVTVKSGSVIGPFANIRTGSFIGRNCRIGNFVEVKNSTIGEGTKIAHMTYVGDAKIGKNCNIGCGVVFVNFDGKKKNQTVVGDNVFIGSNVNLVAPLTLESNSLIAAGSTIVLDVPDAALAIARARQENKENWVNKTQRFREEESVKKEITVVPVEPEVEVEPIKVIEAEPEVDVVDDLITEETKRVRRSGPKKPTVLEGQIEIGQIIEETQEDIGIEPEPEEKSEEVIVEPAEEVITETEPEEENVEPEMVEESEELDLQITDAEGAAHTVKGYDWDNPDPDIEDFYQGRE